MNCMSDLTVKTVFDYVDSSHYQSNVIGGIYASRWVEVAKRSMLNTLLKPLNTIYLLLSPKTKKSLDPISSEQQLDHLIIIVI